VDKLPVLGDNFLFSPGEHT